MRAILCQTLEVGKTFGVFHLRLLALAALLLLALMGAAVVSAQEGGGYNLSWFTVDGGGSTPSTGGGFTLMSTVGQPRQIWWCPGSLRPAIRCRWSSKTRATPQSRPALSSG